MGKTRKYIRSRYVFRLPGFVIKLWKSRVPCGTKMNASQYRWLRT